MKYLNKFVIALLCLFHLGTCFADEKTPMAIATAAAGVGAYSTGKVLQHHEKDEQKELDSLKNKVKREHERVLAMTQIAQSRANFSQEEVDRINLRQKTRSRSTFQLLLTPEDQKSLMDKYGITENDLKKPSLSRLRNANKRLGQMGKAKKISTYGKNAFFTTAWIAGATTLAILTLDDESINNSSRDNDKILEKAQSSLTTTEDITESINK